MPAESSIFGFILDPNWILDQARIRNAFRFPVKLRIPETCREEKHGKRALSDAFAGFIKDFYRIDPRRLAGVNAARLSRKPAGFSSRKAVHG
ncbi:hypothetical protein [Allobaculum sp. Allo2]|uniref:hypothetical protein n=1 Tax=Allobaculum sp. Allo2 TaxID=2853432 RepID=UPI001F6153A9|nr:hypothetical protein [Allobaculum sp. Allo2]UNT94576.1 hypothetical protein KWG61_01670 [Allobaculum sp. Allo2]